MSRLMERAAARVAAVESLKLCTPVAGRIAARELTLDTGECFDWQQGRGWVRPDGSRADIISAHDHELLSELIAAGWLSIWHCRNSRAVIDAVNARRFIVAGVAERTADPTKIAPTDIARQMCELFELVAEGQVAR